MTHPWLPAWLLVALLTGNALQASDADRAAASWADSVVVQSWLVEAPAGTAQKLLAKLPEHPDATLVLEKSMADDFLKKIRQLPEVDFREGPPISMRSREKTFSKLGKLTIEFLPVVRSERVALLVNTTKHPPLTPKMAPIRDGAEMAAVTTLRLDFSQSLLLVSPIHGGPPREMILVVTVQRSATRPALKAAGIILPTFDLDGQSLPEAVEMLRRKAIECDPEGEGVNLLIRDPLLSRSQIQLQLRKVPLAEAIRYVAELGGDMPHYEPFAVVIGAPFIGGGEILTGYFHIPAGCAIRDPLADAQQWLAAWGVEFPEGAFAAFDPSHSQLTVKDPDGALDKAWALVLQFGGSTENLFPPPSAAMKRAARIHISKVEFHEASVTDVVAFLRAQVKAAHRKNPRSPDLDIHLHISHDKPAPKLTLVLHDVPLDEVLRYTARFSGLAPPEGDDAVTLKEWAGF